MKPLATYDDWKGATVTLNLIDGSTLPRVTVTDLWMRSDGEPLSLTVTTMDPMRGLIVPFHAVVTYQLDEVLDKTWHGPYPEHLPPDVPSERTHTASADVTGGSLPRDHAHVHAHHRVDSRSPRLTLNASTILRSCSRLIRSSPAHTR